MFLFVRQNKLLRKEPPLLTTDSLFSRKLYGTLSGTFFPTLLIHFLPTFISSIRFFLKKNLHLTNQKFGLIPFLFSLNIYVPTPYRTKGLRLCATFFSSHLFLAGGLVGVVLLGSFQAGAIYIPAAPDVQGNRAKSKPLLLRCGLGRGWRLVGG